MRIESHLESPGAWTNLPRSFVVRGWAFCPGPLPLTGIRLRAQNLTYSGVYGLNRPDVQAAFASAPSPAVGFSIPVTLIKRRVAVVLEVGFADGSWHEWLSCEARTRQPLLPVWAAELPYSELIQTQMPVQMKYAPRVRRDERFPPRRGGRPLPAMVVVTPSYQQAPFLRECIRSVITENDAPRSYVVQDGGSADGSVPMIRDAAQAHAARFIESPPRISGAGGGKDLPAPSFTWETGQDGGQADAIARGFAKTSGAPEDIMAWINSDDFYLPGALRFVADYFARHPEVDVIYGHRILVDEESREIGRWFLPPHDPVVLQLNDFVPQETLFWRRRLWDKVGGIDPLFNFAMDWDLLLRFQAAGATIVRVPYFLACFRIHPVQKTASAMHHTGQEEIDRLRERTHGRNIPAEELEQNPRLRRYLRRSAWIEFLWRWGIRAK